MRKNGRAFKEGDRQINKNCHNSVTVTASKLVFFYCLTVTPLSFFLNHLNSNRKMAETNVRGCLSPKCWPSWPHLQSIPSCYFLPIGIHQTHNSNLHDDRKGQKSNLEGLRTWELWQVSVLGWHGRRNQHDWWHVRPTLTSTPPPPTNRAWAVTTCILPFLSYTNFISIYSYNYILTV